MNRRFLKNYKINNSSFIKSLFLCCFLFLCAACERIEGGYTPGFDKMKFAVDANPHTLTVKAASMGWSIQGLNINGQGINLDHNPANAKEMELEGLRLSIQYEIETGDYRNPYRISCDMFDILKPTSYRLIIKLEKNTTQKDRVIKIDVGDGCYFGCIDITQKGS